MIEAISAVYGSLVKPAVSKTRPTSSAYEEKSGTPLARWGDAHDTLILYRSSSYATSFRLVVTVESLAGSPARPLRERSCSTTRRHRSARPLASSKKLKIAGLRKTRPDPRTRPSFAPEH